MALEPQTWCSQQDKTPGCFGSAEWTGRSGFSQKPSPHVQPRCAPREVCTARPTDGLATTRIAGCKSRGPHDEPATAVVHVFRHRLMLSTTSHLPILALLAATGISPPFLGENRVPLAAPLLCAGATKASALGPDAVRRSHVLAAAEAAVSAVNFIAPGPVPEGHCVARRFYHLSLPLRFCAASLRVYLGCCPVV